MRSLAIFLLLSSRWVLAGTEKPKSKAEQVVAPPLVAVSEKTTTVKGLGAWGPAQCDADGNLYYHSGITYQASVILKVARDGAAVVYHPDDASVRDESFTGFYVNSDGGLWLLAARQQELYLLEAGDDPTTFSRTKLEMPPGAGPDTVREFVVAPNGASLLAGYFDSTAPKSDRGHAYLLQFDASGNLLHSSVMQVSDAVVKFASESLVGASVASSSNGLNYFLNPDEIVVISQTGEIVRRLKLHPPEPGAEPSQIYAAGGRLLLAYIKVAGSSAPGTTNMLDSTEYQLLDATTGEQLRQFRATPELGNDLGCFSDDGLTFSRLNKEGYAVLATVPVR